MPRPDRTPSQARTAATGQVRIIAGQWRGQSLTVLTHQGLRPSSDRVRETVFNWLNHLCGGQFHALRCLDVFAGSGALGLECVSRGAREVVLIDNHRPAVAQIAAQLVRWMSHDASLSTVRAVQADANTYLEQLQATGAKYDVIFLDPPFGKNELARILPKVAALTHPQTWLYVETERDFDWHSLTAAGWEVVRQGKTTQVAYGILQAS